MSKAIKQKQQEASERQDRYGKLSIEQRIAKLNAKFGANQGAMKERQRLAKLLAKAKEKKE